MCCSRSSRSWYLFVVSLWLLLTVVRQILDSIGRLWIPIVFNSFQIFSCICGLIAAIHWQKRLLIVFILLNFTSVLYNIVLILWYNEYFGISRDIPMLGAGFPHSYSFFLRYTPSCKSYYDLTNFRWVQLPCIVPYYYIEGAQALLHIFIANLSIVLSVVQFPKRSYHEKTEKRISNMIIDGELRTNQFMDDKMNNSKEYNQKYSKEILNLTDREANEQRVRPENGYIRHSAKNSSRLYCKGNIAAHQNPDNFQKPFVVKRSQSMTDLKNECREVGHIYIEESNELINNGLTNMILKSKRSQIAAEKKTGRTANSGCVCRTGSLKNFTVPTTEGVRRILSHEEINLVNNYRTNNALINSTNSNLKSLVSFDPKSNVLLRIHNHIDDDDDDDNSTYRIDTIQRHLQQQQQQYRISKQVKISSIGKTEQMQHRNSKYPSTNYSLANYQSNEPTFSSSDTGKNGYYDLTSFRQCCNHKSPNSSRQQPIWYSKYGDDIMFDGTKQCNVQESSTIGHPKSQIISSMPILNSNDFLV